jgi:hypothetical protein
MIRTITSWLGIHSVGFRIPVEDVIRRLQKALEPCILQRDVLAIWGASVD